jgi:hypothetical protein
LRAYYLFSAVFLSLIHFCFSTFCLLRFISSFVHFPLSIFPIISNFLSSSLHHSLSLFPFFLSFSLFFHFFYFFSFICSQMFVVLVFDFEEFSEEVLRHRQPKLLIGIKLLLLFMVNRGEKKRLNS